VETLLTVDAVRTFAGRPETARAARLWVVGHLSGSPAAGDVALMVSELVTNALRYSRSGLSGGSVTVNLTITAGQLRVDVIDQGPDYEQAGAVPCVDTPLDGVPGLGAGLVIVRQLADTWGAEGPDSWFTLSLGGAIG
jgi:anti-sigma regulatory factor (Ser/Thr protein kinase)